MKEESGNDAITPTKIVKLIFYVFVMLILAIILVLLCLKSILKYNEWPIYTETNIVGQNEARFPAMTFCPLSKGYKEDVLRVRSPITQIILCVMIKIFYGLLFCPMDNYLF
jgi:hypothetical protein